MNHLKHMDQVGFDTYSNLSRVVKEQFVFDALENNKRIWFDLLSEDERMHAIWYILEKVGGIR